MAFMSQFPKYLMLPSPLPGVPSHVHGFREWPQQTVLKARAASGTPASQHRSVLCPASIPLRSSGEPLKWGGVQGPGGVADGAGERLPAEPGHRCTHAALRTLQQALCRLLHSLSSFQGVLSSAPLLFTHPTLPPEVKTVRPLVGRAGSPPFP